MARRTAWWRFVLLVVGAALSGSVADAVAADAGPPAVAAVRPAESAPAALLADAGDDGSAHEEDRPVAADDDAGLYLQLMLMRGHLRVARELMDAGDLEAAAPHLAHPASEHLPLIEAALRARGVEPMDTVIEKAAEAAAAGDEARARTHRAEILVRIDGATHTIDAVRRGRAGFVVPIVLALAHEAAHEYDEAVRDDAFALVDEYQDGRGFVLVARALLDQVGPGLPSTNEAAVTEARRVFERLISFWPGPVPPERPVASPGEVRAAVAELEAALADLDADAAREGPGD